jgi:predicted ArsR family transcriptional regulator
MSEGVLERQGAQLGNSRRRLLQRLLHAAEPLPVDQLARGLGISRNATYQHVIALERDGLIERARISQTGGRPGQTYRLTETGRATFPKHYALIATMLIRILRARLGAAELEALLVELGQSLAADFADGVAGLAEEAQAAAQRHMVAMGLAWICYLAALMSRLNDGAPVAEPAVLPVALSAAGFVLLLVGGWLGGDLVYRRGAGRASDR